MAFTEALRLLITADSGGAVRGINAVGAATDKSLGRSQKSIDKWSKGLTTAGAGMVALGAGALFGLGKAAMASEEANLATLKLENTLANMPRLAGENSKSFIDLAQSIQSKTAADADQIVEAEALLGTFQLTGDEIRKITPLVVDYSRKFGVGMTDAAKQVGKALEGQIGALKRSGVSIDENLFKTDRYAAVTQALRDQVGGFAEEEGKTFAGSLERMKNELGDVAEGVGVGAVDAFSSLFNVVGGGLDKIKELSPATQAIIGKVATFGSVALIAAGGLSFLAGQTLKAVQNFKEMGGLLSGLGGKLSILRLGSVGVAGALVAAGAATALFLRNQNRQEVLASAEAFAKLEKVTKDSAAATGILNDAVRVSQTDFTAGASVQEEFARTGEVTAEVMRDLDKAWDAVISKNPELAAGFIDSAEKIGVSRDKLSEWRGELDDQVGAAASASQAQDAYNQEVAEAAGVTTEAQVALEEYVDSLTSLFDPLFGATDALMDNQEAQRQVAVAAFELAAAEKEHGANSAEAEEAERKLAEAHIAAGKSALDVKQATAELSAAVEDGTVSVADAKDMLNGWVAQGLISHDTAMVLAGQFDRTAAAANKLGDTDPNVAVSETGGSRVRGSLSKVQQAAVNAGRQRPTVRVSARDNASSILRRVQGLIFGIPRSRTFTFNARVTGLQELNRARALTGRQHGGSVRAHEAYLVGEAGPEVLLMGNQSGKIIPDLGSVSGGLAAAGVSSGSGGGGAVHFDFRGAIITNQDEFVRKVSQAVNKGTRLGLVNR